MMSRSTFWIFSCVLVFQEISLAQADDTCQTSADCSANWLYRFCCGGDSSSVDRTRRMCGYHNCLNKYCKTKSHCDDPTFCCRSNTCVDRGCYSCTSNLDCSIDHVCCGKSSLDQAFCAKNCIGEHCKNNNDCVAETECCRSGFCINTLKCYTQCKSNSECDSGRYFCKTKRVWFWQDRCSEKCIGEDCKSNEDCGPRNECCLDGKCTEHECPKRVHYWNSTYQNAKKSSSSARYITIIAIAAPLVIVIGLLISVGFWCHKRKRAANSATDVNATTRMAVTNPQLSSSQLASFNNPAAQQQEIGFGQTCKNPSADEDVSLLP